MAAYNQLMSFRMFEILQPVLGNVSKMDTAFWIKSQKSHDPVGWLGVLLVAITTNYFN